MMNLSYAKIIAVYKKTKGLCWYCGIEIGADNYCIDHVHPRAKGGGDEVENLVPCCKKCNAMKGSRTVERLRFVLSKNKIGCPDFNQIQIDWLKSIGIELPIPIIKFYFEERKLN